MKLIKAAIILFLILLGCSAQESEQTVTVPEHLQDLENLMMYPADAEPAKEISLVQDRSYSDTDNVWLGSIAGIAVDDSGRVFIADGAWGHRAIHVYDLDGRYMAQLAGEGQGPGEFLSFRNMQIVENKLYVYDYEQLRMSVFSVESLTLSHSLNLNPENWRHIQELSMARPHRIFVRNGGLFLVGFTEPLRMPDPDFVACLKEEKFIPSYFYLMDRDGELRQPTDKIFEVRGFIPWTVTTFRSQSSSFNLPFDERSLMAVSAENQIFSAETEDFLINIHDPQGKYLHAFYYPYEKAPLNRDEILNRYDSSNTPHYQAVRNDNLPDTWPALNSMLVDDEGRLWISTIVDDDEVFEWWVLDENGELLARFKWPGERSSGTGYNEIQMVKNRYLYVHEMDEETGMEQVVRYRIEMKEQ